MRSPEQLLASAHAVIDEAFRLGSDVMSPLFSGGYDSLSAVYCASKHPKFDGNVYHIDTGIGCKKTRSFVDETCQVYGWKLNVFRSSDTFEKFIRERGFPGPGRHSWVYNRLKDRCVRRIMQRHARKNVALITGCRSEESVRRMGTVKPLKIGEETVKAAARRRNGSLFPDKSLISNKRRFWTAPCHDWTSEEQQIFMDFYDIPRTNPIKESPIGMSGECFCGAFARPNEIDLIRKYAPDVAMEIERLSAIAKECGKHHVWGTRPDGNKGIVRTVTGPLCNSCDARAMSAGLFVDLVDHPCDGVSE